MNILVNHLGFRTNDPEKQAIIHGDRVYDTFQIVNLTEMGYNEIGPNTQENSIMYRGTLEKKEYEWGTYYIADFSDLTQPGIYLVTLDNTYNSVPFHIRDDLFTRTTHKAFEYIHIQRCGTKVPNYHEACHLDDAIIRENGEHVDTVGGWHDAGDLRKWVEHTLMLGIAICQVKNRLDPSWNIFDPREGDLLNELRWGNQYFLKMQSASGLVWHDVAGGVDGDNSDNHWTDNCIGTKDDRHINTTHNSVIQWEFVFFQSMVAMIFSEADPYYARRCKEAALKTFHYMKNISNVKTEEVAWAILALTELSKLIDESDIHERLRQETIHLISLQEKNYLLEQEQIRGFFYSTIEKNDFYRHTRDGGTPLIALAAAYEHYDDISLKSEIKQSLALYCNEYVLKIKDTNPFAMLPFGVYKHTVEGETYRSIGGNMTYRFFAEVKGKCAFGLNSHLLSHAVGLTMAAKILGNQYLAVIARRQVEWVMGGNTENVCMMSGEGMNNPYPHSRFLGIIPGGIMNGIAGLEDDLPFIEMKGEMDWRTTEYWSPHVAFYLWFVAVFSEGETLDALPY